MANPRSPLDRLFGLCLSFFIACLLIYLGVQLLEAVVSWLIVGGLILGAGALVVALLRWRRGRW